MSLYEKCTEDKCRWHMGYGYDNYTYLNGACYNYNHNKSMFCPLNENSPLENRYEKDLLNKKSNETSICNY